jgi:hypothetical protein
MRISANAGGKSESSQLFQKLARILRASSGFARLVLAT